MGEDGFDIEKWYSEIQLTGVATTKVLANQIEDLNTLLFCKTDVDTLKLSLVDTSCLHARLAALRVKQDLYTSYGG